MERKTRQSNRSFNKYSDARRQIIQITTDETNCLSRKTVTNFEDLSNEIIYEIFEFLDYFHVYEAFFNLNQRFHHLLIHSNLPIKLNLSSMSRSALKRYNKDIIETNMHRINSIHLSDVFRYEVVFSSFGKLSEFSQLETLILNNFEYADFKNILNHLSSLSFLSSLVIECPNEVKDGNTIYYQIVRLPALKYCKLSFGGWTDHEPLTVCINEFSSIEHLIITHSVYLHEIDSLLSYVPHLRRLSFHLLSESRSERTKIFPRLLNRLTHISLKTNSIKFDQFEQLFINIFRTVQVLHFTIDANVDPAYLDANKWEQLIISYIPNLRIFDIRHDVCFRRHRSQTTLEDAINEFRYKMKQFESAFWIERQWVFEHYFYLGEYGHYAIFYSTNPYRRKDYILYKQLEQNTSVNHSESKLDSVQHVRIRSKEITINYKNYFRNANELVFDENFSGPGASVVTILNRIIPLQQLTKLNINCYHFSIRKVIKILCYSSNVHTLILRSMASYQRVNDNILIKQSKGFQLVSNTNIIKTVVCGTECTLEQIKFLIALCPRIEHLIIDTLNRDLKPIIQFLLNKTNPNARYLCSVCFFKAFRNLLEKGDTIIESETLLDAYILKQVGWKLYLWW